MPDVVLTDIHREYEGPTPVRALRGVSLHIRQGDFVAIEGPSGGGKSSLLNVIGLLDRPSSGTYQLDDTPVACSTSRALAELRSDFFAFIFQSFHLLDRRPVIDSVELPLVYRGVPKAERHERALRALRSVGLEHVAQQSANTLSGGEQQRVAIARAFATGAPIVVADEPTGNLDSENSNSVVESLQMLHSEGATIILVTHSSEISAVASRRLDIRDGRLVDSIGQVAMPVVRPDRVFSPPGRASRPRIKDIMRDAAKSLMSRIGRTAGLSAAVAVGVALAVATLGISVSASAQVSSTFDAHTNRDVTVGWNPIDIKTQPEGVRSSVLSRLAVLPGMTSAGLLENFGQHLLRLSRARTPFMPNVYGITANTSDAGRMDITWAQGHEHRLGAGESLVGSTLAGQLDLGPLSGEPRYDLDSRTASIVGIISASPRNPELLSSVLGRAADLMTLGPPNQVKALLLTEPGAAQQVARQAPLIVNPYAPKSITVDAPVDPTKVRAQIEATVQSTLIALTAVALLASIAGLANAMVLSIVERKQEIGLRRALGARPRHVVGLVLIESFFIGALGGVAGLVLGLGGILTVTLVRHWSPVFDLKLAPMAILGGIVVGALGGILASARASNIQPSDALRL